MSQSSTPPQALGTSPTPRFFVQYGQKRTDSTTQFQLLCVAMALLTEREPQPGRPQVTCRSVDGAPVRLAVGSAHARLVVKTHNSSFSHVNAAAARERVWLFCSALQHLLRRDCCSAIRC